MKATPARFTLFPYTTLFRSIAAHHFSRSNRRKINMEDGDGGTASNAIWAVALVIIVALIVGVVYYSGILKTRSEEHTSELQSLRHLVCRLLLEKKKNIKYL